MVARRRIVKQVTPQEIEPAEAPSETPEVPADEVSEVPVVLPYAIP